MPDDDIDPRRLLRCIFGGELFDFNHDLGAVEISHRTAACTRYLDSAFAVHTTLHPNGERPQVVPKVRKKHVLSRHKARRVA